MNRALSSVLVASAFLATGSFAAVRVNPNASATSTVKTEETARSEARKKTMVTFELLGSSNEVNNDSNIRMSSGTTTVTSKGSGSMSGSAYGNGLAVGIVTKPSASFGLEGNLAYLTKKFDSAESNGRAEDAEGDASAKFSTVRATGMVRAYPIEYVSIGVGMYASEFVGPAHITDEDGRTHNESLRDNYYNRFDFGPVFGARGEIPLSTNVAFILDARYFLGIANLIDETRARAELADQLGGGVSVDQYEMSAHTRDLQFAAGIGYRF